MNPAYMTRQVHELAAQVYGLKGHLTSLKPIRPENALDAWEAKALNSFEAGTPEITEVVKSGGEPHLRFMRPWRTEKACLKCHAAQGYKEGDIWGGISLDVPLKPFLAGIKAQTFPLAAGHGLIWVLGLTGIIMGNRRIIHYLGERQQAEETLREREAKYRAAIEASGDGFCIADMSGRFL
jgi:PAS domain-containing protein